VLLVNFLIHNCIISAIMEDSAPFDRYEKMYEDLSKEKIDIHADEQLALIGKFFISFLVSDKSYFYQTKQNISVELFDRPFKPPRHVIS